MELLRDNALKMAQVGNILWDTRLGPHPDLAAASSPAALAQTVARLQADAGMLTDGILGPKTRAYLRGEAWVAPHDNRLLVAGEQVLAPQGLRTVSPAHPHSLSLIDQQAWQKRDDPRTEAIDLMVLHWDECASAHACFHTLAWRQLSAHLLIDADGTVYQTLDLVFARAYHARSHNERSIGIEVQNSLWSPAGTDLTRPLVCEQRAHTTSKWHIRGFTAAQVASLVVLVPWLCKTLNIAPKLPFSGGQVATDKLDTPFFGVCGHYHLQQDKTDPGMSLWPPLAQALGLAPSG